MDRRQGNDDGPSYKRFRSDNDSTRGARGGYRGGSSFRGSPGRGGGGGGFRNDRTDRESSSRFQDRNGSQRQDSGRQDGGFNKPYQGGVDRRETRTSRVLHIRGLRDYATDNDIVDAVSKFGRVSYVTLMKGQNQALCEMENMSDAEAVVRYTEKNPIYICGLVASFGFSMSDAINRNDGNQRGDMSRGTGSDGTSMMTGNNSMQQTGSNMGGGYPDAPNKILVFNVMNAKYPINAEVLKTICSSHGEVLRIMCQPANNGNVRTMVEFEQLDSANKAKQALQGCDIYSGCCTLNIEFAPSNVTRLNVTQNDKDTMDYTTNNPGGPPPGKSLLGDAPPPHGNGPQGGGFAAPQAGGFAGPQGGSGPQGGGGGNWRNEDRRGGDYTQPAFMNEPNQGMNRGGNFNDRGGQFNNGGNGPMGGPMNGPGGFNGPNQSGPNQGGPNGPGGRFNDGPGGRFNNGPSFQGPGGPPGPMQGGPMQLSPSNPMPGCVLMVSGLEPSKFNCDRVYSLFCSYGNVSRIKWLMSREGQCMVNMQDRGACERVVMNLNRSYIFGKELNVTFSKADFVKIHPQPNQLKDGSPNQREYGGAKTHRFFSEEMVMKTRFSPPTRVLHFYAAPPSAKEADLLEVFKKTESPTPTRVRIFPVKPGAKSCSGLVEFTGLQEAGEALVLASHYEIPNRDGRRPFLLKLAFSASPILDKPGYDDHKKDN